jgi:catechol 2,3-dioxygenase-like lactoylglutathione lyase family enzyme
MTGWPATYRFALVLLLVTRSRASAQSHASPTLVANGAFVAISVADLQRATSWYQEKLGLRVTMSISRGAGTNGGNILEGEGLIVEILQSDSGVVRHSAPVPASTIGIVKAGAIVADFDRLVADLRSKSVDIAFGPYAAHNGQRANVIVRDLDGNLIQFFGR